MNPFELRAKPMESLFENWKELYPRSYAKLQTSPFTKMRIILMNGTEFEAVSFSHRFNRHCSNNDIRRELALTRRMEQQQQKKISCLKPINESILEHTISYEQLAVELTAVMAKTEPDLYVKAALDFALLEDFDHLYRYSDLMMLETGQRSENIVRQYTEIMPGRPTIAHHRHPFDSVRRSVNFKNAAPITKLHTQIITAAEQQTMNYYMNAAPFYTSDLGRNLYQEIAQVEEQHVTHYGSLLDPTLTWLENLLQHEYTECYLYYSCAMDETDSYVRTLWEACFEMEVAHVQKAAQLLEKYEGKHWNSLVPGDFPPLLRLTGNAEYVRQVLADTVWLTANLEDYVSVCDLPENSRFWQYQNIVNPTPNIEPGHQVIQNTIRKYRHDYRRESAPNPIPELNCRTCDNTDVGRICSQDPCLQRR